MNKLFRFGAALLFAGASLAATADTPADQPAAVPGEYCQHQMGPMGGMMRGNALPAEAMTKMQEQMAKIRQTSDPAERQTLMKEHFKSMQEAMQAMHATPPAGDAPQGIPCPSDCAKSKTGKSCQKSASCRRAAPQVTGPAAPGMAQMQQRMDMMQTMMENMLEHQRQMQQGK